MTKYTFPCRAQSLLGFTSARWMENNKGLEPKDILDIALKEQMYKVIEYKRQVAKDKVINQINF